MREDGALYLFVMIIERQCAEITLKVANLMLIIVNRGEPLIFVRNGYAVRGRKSQRTAGVKAAYCPSARGGVWGLVVRGGVSMRWTWLVLSTRMA